MSDKEKMPEEDHSINNQEKKVEKKEEFEATENVVEKSLGDITQERSAEKGEISGEKEPAEKPAAPENKISEEAGPMEEKEGTKETGSSEESNSGDENAPKPDPTPSQDVKEVEIDGSDDPGEKDSEGSPGGERKKSRDAQGELDDAVAEDSEDESAGSRHEIVKKDYHALSKEDLVREFENLLKKEKIQTIKDHVEELKAEFNAKYEEQVEQKKEEFLADGGNIIDFHYTTPLKKKFNSLYFEYKERRNKYYQRLKQDLNQNLEKRLEIIEELKGLIDVEENINTTYKHFKDLQERWRNAGAIPRDKYNTVWNTYHHHVENFYDFLHLNREFRDLDFKHNLDQKLKIITRAEELTQEEDTNRAFRELQMLHKMWKEDLGPVQREYREEIWKQFSEATKKIHDKRQEYFDQLEREFEKNLEKKEEIIGKIREKAETDYSTHKEWQQKIKEIEALREQFFAAGKVPRNVNDQTWKRFKEVVRTFNRNKNSFYKNQKKEQYENLEKKLALVKTAEENKDNEDLKETAELMKKIQSQWKTIGHVPRKDSDKIWKKFKTACNHFFDRLHTTRNEENKEENEAFENKKEILEAVRSLDLSGDKDKALEIIKEYIEKWKNSGRVPYNKRYMEGKFNKTLDQAFEKLDLDQTQKELIKYENKIQALEDADDSRKIENEAYFLSKKIEETKSEIRQLENNLQFFSNVNDDNPVVLDVHRNIEKQKDQLKVWQEKFEKVKTLY